MLSRMVPSSPPARRTLHLLKTPDILCANDSGPTGSYPPVNNIDGGEVFCAERHISSTPEVHCAFLGKRPNSTAGSILLGQVGPLGHLLGKALQRTASESLVLTQLTFPRRNPGIRGPLRRSSTLQSRGCKSTISTTHTGNSSSPCQINNLRMATVWYSTCLLRGEG